MTALASELLAAMQNGTVVDPPPSTNDPAFDVTAAYAVGAEIERFRAEAGHVMVGRKVGYANKAMWRVLKLDSLVWAPMYDDTVHPGATTYSLGPFISPRIEPELVFKMKEPMNTGGLEAETILQSVEWMALGYEIVDCPYPNWQYKPADFIAACGIHKGLVLGPPCPVGTAADIAGFKVRLLKNGELADEGAGKNCLRSPALCLAELAGVTALGAGELISTGSLTSAQPIAAGETWRFEVEGLEVPALTLTITA